MVFFNCIALFAIFLSMVMGSPARSSPQSIPLDPTSNGYLLLPLTNRFGFFTAEISVWGQTTNLLIDTGSADTWVMSNTNPYCEGSNSTLTSFTLPNRQTVNISHSYDCSQAVDTSSFVNSHNTFYVAYPDSFVYGSWTTDTIGVGGFVVNQTFAVGNISNSFSGILGLAPASWETSPSQYDNFPLSLIKNGIVSRNLFGIHLSNASDSTVIFGGVDTAKYNSLVTLPIISSGYNIPLAGLGLDSTPILGSNIQMLVDTGSTFCTLPGPVLDYLGQQLNGTNNTQIGYWQVDCSLKNAPNTLQFIFGSANIANPLGLHIQEISDFCVLAIRRSTSDTGILGQSFLLSAYTVIDIDNLQVSLGQLVENDFERIQAVSGTSMVPNATSITVPLQQTRTSLAIGTWSLTTTLARPTTVSGKQSTANHAPELWSTIPAWYAVLAVMII